MLALILAIWCASTSVSDEIEGRTALTVLSKPIDRKSFVLGKFVGIAWVLALLFLMFALVFLITISHKPIYDAQEASGTPTPPWQQCHAEMLSILPGMLLTFMESMVLVSLSVMISTRLPMMVNFVLCFALYALGHLTPLIVESSTAGFEVVRFFARLVAVFIPVAVMGGITGSLYKQFAITVAVSVCFSSLNALTLSPALCSLLLRKQKPYRGPLGVFFGLFNKAFDKSIVSYMGLTRKVARKMVSGMVFIVILVTFIVVLGKSVPGGFMPEEDMGYFLVNIQLPDAASLQRTDAVTKKIEKIIAEIEDVEYVTAAAGYNLLAGAYTSNGSVIFVSLKDWSVRDKTAKEIVAELNVTLASSIKEATAFAFGPPAIPGLGNGSGFSLMIQDKGGNEPDYLAKWADSYINAATKRAEIGSVFTTFRASVPQRYMEINKDKVLKAGIRLDDIYTTVGAFLGGTYVNDFNRFGRLYKAYIQAEPEYRLSEDKVDLFFVNNEAGDSVPLSAFVNIKELGLIPPLNLATSLLKYLCHQAFSPSFQPLGIPIPSLALANLALSALSNAINL